MYLITNEICINCTVLFQELCVALKKEEDLINELQNLQLEAKSSLKENELKLSESLMEAVEYKAKVCLSYTVFNIKDMLP